MTVYQPGQVLHAADLNDDLARKANLDTLTGRLRESEAPQSLVDADAANAAATASAAGAAAAAQTAADAANAGLDVLEETVAAQVAVLDLQAQAIAAARAKADAAIPASEAGVSIATLAGGVLATAQVPLTVSNGAATPTTRERATRLVFPGATISGGANEAIVSLPTGGTTAPSTETRPSLASFTQFNWTASTSALDTTGGALGLKATIQATDAIVGLELPLPAASGWTARARLRNQIPSTSTLAAGLYLRQSSNDYLIAVFSSTAPGRLNGQQWKGRTTYFVPGWASAIIFGVSDYSLRIDDDGTNRTYYWSTDGNDLNSPTKLWNKLVSEPRTTFLIPDLVGFGINPKETGTAYAGMETGVSLRAWSVKTL